MKLTPEIVNKIQDKIKEIVDNQNAFENCTEEEKIEKQIDFHKAQLELCESEIRSCIPILNKIGMSDKIQKEIIVKITDIYGAYNLNELQVELHATLVSRIITAEFSENQIKGLLKLKEEKAKEQENGK